MEDVALDEHRAERREPRFGVEPDGVILRVERDTRETARARVVDQGIE